MEKKKRSSFWLWFILIAVIIIIAVVISIFLNGSTNTISIDEFYTQYSDGNIATDGVVVYFGYNGTATITGYILQDDGTSTRFVVRTAQSVISNDLEDWGFTIVADLSSSTSTWLSSLLPLLIMIIFYVVIFWLFSRSAAGGAGGQSLFSMGKNRAKQTRSNVKFSDVAGIEEEKAELVELVDYLKNPQKYADAGARVPKGVLLEGPPGTGKTLLAKAVAGEAGVAFLAISGSEFEEMFVGIGASRVREMFNDAKKAAPCIIFIDEIDAVGRKRSGSIGGATNEQTLNQLLVEMDGFGTNSGVIVMAATNRSDVLDPALLRPGRFDRVISVSLPDIKEREAILKLHARNKKIDSSINWHRVAERTPGFSGAQLENVLNEAAILMVREKRTTISIREIDEAIDRVVGGPAKKSRSMTLLDKDIVSYHESGHALVGLKLEGASKVQKVTIIPRGNAGGYTIMTPKDETVFSSKKDLNAMIAGYLGGRAAEEIIFGKENITTGAHDDLDKATNIARRMVVQFGMSSLGMTKFLTMAEESYGKMEGTYSDKTAAKIDDEIQKILDKAYKDAVSIIKSNKKELSLLAESLRVLETITAEQIEFIDKKLKLPKEVIDEKERYSKEERKKKNGDIIEIDVDDVDKDLSKKPPKSSVDKKIVDNIVASKYEQESKKDTNKKPLSSKQKEKEKLLAKKAKEKEKNLAKKEKDQAKALVKKEKILAKKAKEKEIKDSKKHKTVIKKENKISKGEDMASKKQSNKIATTSKKDIIGMISKNENITTEQAENIAVQIFKEIQKALIKGEEISIPDFGKLHVVKRSARIGINPTTGEKISIKASKAAKFKASKHLKDLLNPNRAKSQVIVKKVEEIIQNAIPTPINEPTIEKPIENKNQENNSQGSSNSLFSNLSRYEEQLPTQQVDKTLSIEERSKLDGSQFIKESINELQKYAYKLTVVALEHNIEIKGDSNLKEMTKREIINYMIRIANAINKKG